MGSKQAEGDGKTQLPGLLPSVNSVQILNKPQETFPCHSTKQPLP